MASGCDDFASAIDFLTLYSRAYLYLSCVILIQVRNLTDEEASLISLFPRARCLLTAGICLCQEIHAPFTHIGWIMAKQGRTADWKWDVNQVRAWVYSIVFSTGEGLSPRSHPVPATVFTHHALGALPQRM